MAERRKAKKSTQVDVRVGLDGSALIVRFLTLDEEGVTGETTVAVTIQGARNLARMLDEGVKRALATHNVSGPRH